MALVSVSRRDDGVAVVTLEHPPANALSVALLDELAGIARSLAVDPPGAVVITGGPRIFAAGADISEFVGPAAARRVTTAFRDALDAVAVIPRATIAAVSGYALGGGCELALACDLRVADERAKFGQPEVLLGIIPGGGASQRLPRLIGPARAKDMILSGRQVAAGEAHAIGLADRVVPAGEAVAAATEWAAEFARGPLVAHALAKHAIDAGLDGTVAEGLGLEQQLFGEVFNTDDARIGIDSFKENGPGKAKFTGQ